MTQITQLPSRNLVKKGSDHVRVELFHNQRPCSSFLSSGSIVLLTVQGYIQPRLLPSCLASLQSPGYLDQETEPDA